MEGLTYLGRGRTVFLTVSAVVAVGVLVTAHAVMLPFVLALIVAYVLTPGVRRVERAGLPRWGAILIVYAVSLGVVGGFVSMIVPRLVTEGRALGAEWPNLHAKMKGEWLPAMDERLIRWTGQTPEPPVAAPPGEPPEKPAPVRVVKREDGAFDVHVGDDVRLVETREGTWHVERAPQKVGLSSATLLEEGFDRAGMFLKDNAFLVLKVGRQVVEAVSKAVFTLFMTLMLAGYLILTHEKIIAFFRDLWPPGARESFDRFLRRLDRGLSGVVRGQLLICLVNGVLSAIGFWLFDLKYWPILSILAAVLSLIPIFGSILSTIPAVAIGLTQSFATALGVLAWVVAIHQLEANFLNPKIIGDSAKIHPVLVVFSLLVGEHFFQIAGALFAVPCLSIVQTIFLHFRESTLGLADPTASIPPPGRLSPRPPLRVESTPTPGSGPEAASG